MLYVNEIVSIEELLQPEDKFFELQFLEKVVIRSLSLLHRLCCVTNNLKWQMFVFFLNKGSMSWLDSTEVGCSGLNWTHTSGLRSKKQQLIGRNYFLKTGFQNHKRPKHIHKHIEDMCHVTAYKWLSLKSVSRKRRMIPSKNKGFNS